MAASLMTEAGVIPVRMGSRFTGVANTLTGIICRTLLWMKSSFLTW